MNLLIKVLQSSQKGKQRPWYSHRYTGRFLALIICVCAFQYYHFISPRDYQEIVQAKELRVGYIKAPEVAFEHENQSAGLELDIIKAFAKDKKLKIKLFRVQPQNALLKLNTNKFDVLIGFLASKKAADFNPAAQKTSLQNLFIETDSILESPLVIFEHKKLKTPKSSDLSAIENLHINSQLSDQYNTSNKHNVIPNTDHSVIEQIHLNEAPYGITTSIQLKINQKFYPQTRSLLTLDEKVRIVWHLPYKNSSELSGTMNTFLAKKSTKQHIKKRKEHWSISYKDIDFIDRLTISKRIKTTLPKLRPYFEEASKKENIDWLLLAALSYQESHWDVDAISPTNVKGIMQLTGVTAKTLGVKDRTNIKESINAAARYLKKLEQRVPVKAQRNDRIWMAVAAYNIGFRNVLSAYRKAVKQNSKPLDWKAIAKQLNKKSNSLYIDRYTNGPKAVKYVARIKQFQEILMYYSQK